MAVRDKVSAIEFSVETGLGPAQIREAAGHAAESGKRLLGSTITESGVNGSSIQYLAKGPGGLVKQMAMTVAWRETSNGRRQVTFSVGNYLTTQSKLLMLIPIGPKMVPALPSARRFAESLHAELVAS